MGTQFNLKDRFGAVLQYPFDKDETILVHESIGSRVKLSKNGENYLLLLEKNTNLNGKEIYAFRFTYHQASKVLKRLKKKAQISQADYLSCNQAPFDWIDYSLLKTIIRKRFTLEEDVLGR